MLVWRILANRKFSPEQRDSLHALSVQIFIGTAVLMAGALILMSFSLSSLKEARSLNEATEDKLLAMTTIESRLIDSDAALTGYVMSGDPWYAGRIVTNRKEMTETLAWLGNAVRDDPALYPLYQRLSALISKRQRFYDYLADPAHSDEVAHVERSPMAGAERHFTDEARGRLWDLLRYERSRRFAHHTAMIREASRSVWVAVSVVALALLSGTISLLLARLSSRPAKDPE